MYSDNAQVSFRAVDVTGTTALIEPIGGVYQFESDATLYVPTGAVETTVPVKIELYDSRGALSKLPSETWVFSTSDTGLIASTGKEERAIMARYPDAPECPTDEYRKDIIKRKLKVE